MSELFPIENDPRWRISTATAGQTEFSVPFPFQSIHDIRVTKEVDSVITVLTLGVDYTISGADVPEGGTVTLVVPCVGGEKIYRIGQAVIDRVTSIVRQGKFSSVALDNDLDRNVILLMEFSRDLGRSWKVPFGQAAGEIAIGTNGTVAAFQDGGIVEGPKITEVSAAQSYAEEAQRIAAEFGDVEGAILVATEQAALSAGHAVDAEEAKVLAVTARGEAEGFADDALIEADRAEAEADRGIAGAAVEANRAEAAADAAQLSAGVYADATAGLAATSDGDYFNIPSASDPESLVLYLNSLGTAVEQKRYPSVLGVDRVEQAASLTAVQPNLVSTRADRIESTIDFNITAGMGTLLASTVSNGFPCWRMTSTATSPLRYIIPRDVVEGQVVSASVFIVAMSAAGAGATLYNNRVLLRQMNGSSEIMAVRQEVTIVEPIGGALTSPLRIKMPNVAIHADCTTVELYFELQNADGATPRTLDFREMVIASGPNPDYRPPHDATKVDSDARIQRRQGWSWTENDFPDPMFLNAGATVNWPIGGDIPVVTTNGRRCIRTPSSASATSRRAPYIDVSDYTSGLISASCVIEAKDVTAEAALRVRLYARDAGGGLLNWPDYSEADEKGTNYYSRWVPTDEITSPTTVVLCSGVQLPAGAVEVGFDIRIETTVQMDLTKITIREGADPSFKPNYDSILQNSATVGTSGIFSTVDDALDALGGTGVITLVDNEYGPEQRITPAKVVGVVHIIGQTGYSEAPPIIRLAEKVTGITKTAGQTKVYQADVAGLPTLANFQWAYQDGVGDPRTEIGSGRKFPQHEGRTHRLKDIARLLKTTATVLGDALDEMDGATDDEPMAFVDDGTLYFTIVGGGDGTAADIYLDAATGLVSSAAERSAGLIEFQNVEVRYGGADLRPFRKALLSGRFIAHGSRGNLIDYSDLGMLGFFEGSCSGSQSELNGDVLNGHGTATLLGMGTGYIHDAWDDGESNHDGGRSYLGSGYLFEYVGGSACAPAYGCDALYDGVVSHKCQQRAGFKNAAFSVIGAPADGTGETRAVFRNCIDYESDTSFGTSSAVEAVGQAIGCKSINPTTRGFQRLALTDCSGVGNGTVTDACTVENTTTVA